MAKIDLLFRIPLMTLPPRLSLKSDGVLKNYSDFEVKNTHWIKVLRQVDLPKKLEFGLSAQAINMTDTATTAEVFVVYKQKKTSKSHTKHFIESIVSFEGKISLKEDKTISIAFYESIDDLLI